MICGQNWRKLDDGLVQLTTSTPLPLTRISPDVLFNFQAPPKDLCCYPLSIRKLLITQCPSRCLLLTPRVHKDVTSFPIITRTVILVLPVPIGLQGLLCKSFLCLLGPFSWIVVEDHNLCGYSTLSSPHFEKKINIFCCCCNWLMSTSTATFTLTCLNILAVTSYQNFCKNMFVHNIIF